MLWRRTSICKKEESGGEDSSYVDGSLNVAETWICVLLQSIKDNMYVD